MINTRQVIFHTYKNTTMNTLLCPFTQYASPLAIATAAAASSLDNPICILDSSSRLPNFIPETATLPSVSTNPYHEPWILFNFDMNPNTSVFSMTFLAATIFQLTGFYFFRFFVLPPSKDNSKNTKRLSWVLTMFSSFILATGIFTLSSDMEWNPSNGESIPTLLSMRKFPIESDIATMYSAYFISYLITDLTMGIIYYRRYLDPLSGWMHHLGYLGVVSNATLQRNVSTLFAIGTPIELSTIFLSIGHIFPQLRSDLLFGISFFLIRIVYPIVLLPDLYLNVEARLCWKVCLSALVLHVHWFSKLVQQQIRYHHARKGCATQTTLKPSISHESTKKDNIIHEYPLQVPMNNNAKVESLPDDVDIKQTKKNSLSGLHQTVLNQVEINGSGRRMGSKGSKALRRSACPSFDLAYCDDESEAKDKVTPIPVVTPAKTMKELLEECEKDDLSSYAFPVQGIVGNGNNKTFSPQALSRLISNKGSESAVTGGALRLSRGSSMRDSKKRVSLGSIKFEESKASVSRPKSMIVGTSRSPFEGDATVVFRQRASRASVVLEDPEEKDQGYDFDIGTIRAARGVSVNA